MKRIFENCLLSIYPFLPIETNKKRKYHFYTAHSWDTRQLWMIEPQKKTDFLICMQIKPIFHCNSGWQSKDWDSVNLCVHLTSELCYNLLLLRCFSQEHGHEYHRSIINLKMASWCIIKTFLWSDRSEFSTHYSMETCSCWVSHSEISRGFFTSSHKSRQIIHD